MTPTFQTRLGDDGNCLPACLATIFDVPIEEVDHCAGHYKGWAKRVDEWLSSRGMYYFEVEWGDSNATAPPHGQLVILSGTTSIGTQHAVVAVIVHTSIDADGDVDDMEAQIIHDPTPGACGEFTPDSMIVFGALMRR